MRSSSAGAVRNGEDRLLACERYDEAIATPFDWRFTKDDLQALMRKLESQPEALRPAA